MKKTAAELLPIYRANLAKYEAEGRAEQAAIERRLIARLEQEAARRATKEDLTHEHHRRNPELRDER